MARTHANSRRTNPSSPPGEPAPTAYASAKSAHGGTVRPIAVVLGALFLALSTAMSLVLVLEHLGGMSLPGCGAGSPCAQATASKWGAIRWGLDPGTGRWAFEWPVSYLGLAYFLAALITWIATRGAVSRSFRWLVRLGALASLGFCGILAFDRLLCPYCLASHAGNFAFWLTMEFSAARLAPLTRPRLAFASVAGVFILATAVLGVSDWQHRAAVARKAEDDLNNTVQQIIKAGQQQTPTSLNASQPSAPTGTQAAVQPRTTTAPAGPITTTKAALPAPAAPAGPFTGRYRRGPEQAAIRIVMITDYQCPDCQRIEKQVSQVFKERDDVSLSIKHFPFCMDCNSYVKVNLHPNACWAARAAEAAGILWGNDGFWKMHDWLFDHKGLFQSTKELEDGIRQLGYDPQGFAAAMSDTEPLRRIQDDIREAVSLGLYFTPMIFINGVELKGWTAPNAVQRAVAEIAASHPPPRTAAYDHPPTALDKYIADWRDWPVLQMPADNPARVLGAPNARVRIVVWGDYQEANTATVDAVIRAFVTSRNDAAYTFRHYPFNSDCNPNLKEQRHKYACRASQAAEAAGRLAGNDGYWKMHAWLMTHQQPLDDATLRTAAAELGFAPDKLLAAMAQPEVDAAIKDDIQAGGKLPVLRHGAPKGVNSIPSLFVNEKLVPRWQLEGQQVLERILAEAAAP